VYAWVVVISLLFIAVALVTYKEKKEMNCEQCKFAIVVRLGTKPECTKKPAPTPTKDGKCYFFIKNRQK